MNDPVRRQLAVLAALSAVVLVGGPVASAGAAPVSHPGTMKPTTVKCDEVPIDYTEYPCVPEW